MFLIWLVILVLYGLTQGWAAVPALAWWLLVPFLACDCHTHK
jgi:hypothetical protein